MAAATFELAREGLSSENAFRRDSEIPFDLGRIDSSTANRSAIVTNNRVTDSATNWPYGV
jgi:hypothetical protein